MTIVDIRHYMQHLLAEYEEQKPWLSRNERAQRMKCIMRCSIENFKDIVLNVDEETKKGLALMILNRLNHLEENNINVLAERCLYFSYVSPLLTRIF